MNETTTPLDQLSALTDATRWRIVEHLAEQPHSVGALAELCDIRQPQATKHLQTLERAGIVASRRSGNRRIYALQVDALRTITGAIGRLIDIAAANSANRDRFDTYMATVDAETVNADRDRWADGREYTFTRILEADRREAWRHLTDPTLLRQWWTTHDLRLHRIEFGAHPGDRVVQEYVDATSRRGAEEVVGRAEGQIDQIVQGSRISFRLSPLLPDGSIAFTAHYDWRLAEGPHGTALDVAIRISDSKVPAAEFVAGIRLGWEQSLDNLVALLAPTQP